jgi:hypothetical protein
MELSTQLLTRVYNRSDPFAREPPTDVVKRFAEDSLAEMMSWIGQILTVTEAGI